MPVGACIALIVLAGVALALTQSANGFVAVGAGALLILVVAVPLLLRLRSERLDATGLYALVTVIQFGFTSLAWLSPPAPSPGPGLDQFAIARAEVLVAGGLLAFTVGAWVAAGRPRAAPSDEPAPDGRGLDWRVAAVVYIVFAGAIALGLATHSYGYLNTSAGGGILHSVLPFIGDQANIVVLAVAVAWLRSRDRMLGRALAIMLFLQVLLGFAAGVKGDSLYAMGYVLLAWLAYGNAIPRKWVVLGFLAVILVLLPANQAYRYALRSGHPSVGSALQTLLHPSLYRPDRTAATALTDLGVRFRDIDPVALIERDTPRLYAIGDGSSYYLLPLTTFVPRAVWPGKPVFDAAGQFAQTYWQIPPSIHTSQPVTQPGDLYRNFGLAGVLIGLLVWGLVIGGWERLRKARASPRMTVVYLASVITAVIYLEGDLPELIATVTKSLPISYTAAWLLLPGRKSGPGYLRILGLTKFGRRGATAGALGSS